MKVTKAKGQKATSDFNGFWNRGPLLGGSLWCSNARSVTGLACRELGVGLWKFETAELDDDGRWIAGVLKLTGGMAYGATRDEAIVMAEALALRIIAERPESHELPATSFSIAVPAAA
jgi:predicted RNase H-like HicB family nuclease